jgi:hypothetical protein
MLKGRNCMTLEVVELNVENVEILNGVSGKREERAVGRARVERSKGSGSW